MATTWYGVEEAPSSVAPVVHDVAVATSKVQSVVDEGAKVATVTTPLSAGPPDIVGATAALNVTVSSLPKATEDAEGVSVVVVAAAATVRSCATEVEPMKSVSPPYCAVTA